MKKSTYPLEHDNPQLIQAAKIKAMQEGKSLKDVILQFLINYVNKE